LQAPAFVFQNLLHKKHASGRRAKAPSDPFGATGLWNFIMQNQYLDETPA
jgi:hypothetical protein